MLQKASWEEKQTEPMRCIQGGENFGRAANKN